MNIVLGVSGSISAYKAFDLLRLLTKAGHQVKVILTKGAQEFVLPQTFHYLGAKKVYLPQDDFKSHPETTVLHIDLAKWADQLIIAPASANTLAKLANGQADDLLSSLFLAWPTTKGIQLFPAMNTGMLEHPFTLANREKLKSLKNLWIAPTQTGELVCGDQGEGKLLDIQEIFHLIETHDPTRTLKKRVLITCGATVSPVDPVRFMSNPSSGITGYYLAKNFLSQGYYVQLVHGHQFPPELEYLRHHPNIEIIQADKVLQMQKVVEEKFPKTDVYISAAAICDYLFDEKNEKEKKIKNDGILHYHPAPDILAGVLHLKTPKQVVISFAAETETTAKIFQEKWDRKPTDLMVGNKVHSGLVNKDNIAGFKTNAGHYFFVKEGKIVEEVKLSKDELSKYLVHFVEEQKQ